MSDMVNQQSVALADSETNAAESKLREQSDVLEKLLDPEVQASLTELVGNLPKLVEMVRFLTKAYDFGVAVATDKVLIEDLTGGVTEFAKPIIATVKGYAAAAMEASDRAKADNTPIGLFGLVKMLKDPQMQKMLHFVQSFLAVLAEKEKAAQK
ncbi:MAG: DUF1641 domain-containing protein [Alicyclobacillus sp.]|nr:DUF1641 domain-containing protein [Alicyclobacillus sp.]